MMKIFICLMLVAAALAAYDPGFRGVEITESGLLFEDEAAIQKSLMAAIDGYDMVVTGVSAINHETQDYYCFLKNSAGDTLLVIYNLITKTVVSHEFNSYFLSTLIIDSESNLLGIGASMAETDEYLKLYQVSIQADAATVAVKTDFSDYETVVYGVSAVDTAINGHYSLHFDSAGQQYLVQTSLAGTATQTAVAFDYEVIALLCYNGALYATYLDTTDSTFKFGKVNVAGGTIETSSEYVFNDATATNMVLFVNTFDLLNKQAVFLMANDDSTVATAHKINPATFVGTTENWTPALSWFDLVYFDDDDCQQSGVCNGHGVCHDLIASYSCTCDEGYSGDDCEIIHDCGAPVFDDAQLTVLQTTYGSTVDMKCDEGYKFSDDETGTTKTSQTLLCTVDGWKLFSDPSAEVPTCIVNVCGDPPFVEYAKYVCDKKSLGGKCTYTPMDGWVQVDGETLSYICQAPNWELDETVTYTGNFTRVSCSAPGTIANGNSDGGCDSSSMVYGDVCTYECVSGHEFVKSINFVECTADGTLSEMPVCSAVACGTQPSVENAESTCDGSAVGSTCTYTCTYGTIMGDATITCDSTGSWSNPPMCMVSTCDAPPAFDYGTYSCEYPYTVGKECVLGCVEGYELSSTEPTIKCENDGSIRSWTSAGSPSCAPKACPAVVLENGAVSGCNPAMYGDVCTASCNEGYYLSGSATFSCGDDAYVNQPTCEPVSCLVPAIAHASTSVQPSQLFYYGTPLTVTCDAGYTTSSSTLSCKSDGTVDALPVCTPVQCPFFEGDSYSVSCEPSSTAPGSSCVFTCTAGYLNDLSTNVVTCQTDGTWTETPSCSVIDCGTFDYASYGYQEVIAPPKTTYGEEGLFQCAGDSTYTLTAKCGLDGWFDKDSTTSDVPYCLQGAECATITEAGVYTLTYDAGEGSFSLECLQTGYQPASTPTCSDGKIAGKLLCSPVTCEAPLVDNGSFMCETGVDFADQCTLVCDPGYVLDQPESAITCEASGSWSASLACVPKTCTGFTVDGASLTLDGAAYSGADLSYSNEVLVDCGSGVLYGDSSVRCQHDGTLSELPSCEPATCQEFFIAQSVMNPDCTRLEEGASCEVSCAPGYQLSGASTVTCTAGSLSTLPTCSDVVVCGTAAPTVANSLTTIPQTVAAYSSGDFTAGMHYDYGCKTNYYMKDNLYRVVCLDDGSFSTLPECVINSCSEPDFAHTTYTCTASPTDGLYGAGTACTFTCASGFSGDEVSLTCTDGVWAGTTAPSCSAGHCADLSDFSMGTYDCGLTTSYTLVGTTCDLSCAPGYQVGSSDTETICEDTLAWSSSVAPQCEIFDCGSPSTVDNSVSQCDPSTTFGSKCNYTCDDGYSSADFLTVVCLKDGWSAYPRCIEKSCDAEAVSVSNGYISSACEDISVSDSCTVSCFEGYTGGGSIVCGDEGWLSLPRCSLFDCGAPSSPEHGSYSVSSTKFSNDTSGATLSCADGYKPSNTDGAIYCRTGGWSGASDGSAVLPVCEPKSCGSVDPVEHSSSDCSGDLTYGDSCKFTCDTGYSMSGSSSVYCTVSYGEMTLTSPPTCLPKTCGSLSVAHASVSCSPSAYEYPRSCTVSCNEGYVFNDTLNVGNIEAVCTDLGTPSTVYYKNGEVYLPTCEPVSCGAVSSLHLSNVDSYSCGASANMEYGDTCTVDCIDNYVTAESVISCVVASNKIQGEFSSAVSCNPYSCDNPTLNENLNHDYVNIDCGESFTYSYPDVCAVSCDRGYRLNNTDAASVSISCLESTSGWSNIDTIECVACSAIVNCTSVTCNSTHTVCHGCSAGFEPLMNETTKVGYCSNIDDCASDPCQNGGECVDEIGGFVCVCAEGFSGTTCDNEDDQKTSSSGPSNNEEEGGGSGSGAIGAIGGAAAAAVLIGAGVFFFLRRQGQKKTTSGSSSSMEFNNQTGEYLNLTSNNTETIGGTPTETHSTGMESAEMSIFGSTSLGGDSMGSLGLDSLGTMDSLASTDDNSSTDMDSISSLDPASVSLAVPDASESSSDVGGSGESSSVVV
eukprot:GCRY01000541.1.p1 GENE.GCRY01000541.1~~GCRY01000541.1.p1  ORF type:complete len:2029 (-),score=233.72 GCRY01000541.1:154-6240(-)